MSLSAAFAAVVVVACVVGAHGRAEVSTHAALLAAPWQELPSGTVHYLEVSSPGDAAYCGWWLAAVLCALGLLILPLGCVLAVHLKAGGNNWSTFVAFLLTGCGCGWFCNDAVNQLVTNEHAVQQGGRMFGTLAVLCGLTALTCLTAYACWILLCPTRSSQRAEQHLVTVLILVEAVALMIMGGFWHVGAPTYPVVMLTSAVGVLVATTTYLIVFTHVATYYGGWLVGPLRTGTDLSTLITTLLAEVQNPTGRRNRFPSHFLFIIYAVVVAAGLAAWMMILEFGVGRRSDSKIAAEKKGEGQKGEQQFFSGVTVKEWFRQRLHVIECAPELAVPIMLAILADVLQCGLSYSLVNVGARMTDPEGCDGERGAFVYRTAVTLNRTMLPLGSLAASFSECPAAVFRAISFAQVISALAVCLAVLGVGRSRWSTPAGQALFVACFTLVGILWGYLLTMAFRYIGDAVHLPMKLRQSSSRLLGLLVVLLEQPLSITIGSFVNAGVIRCRPP